MLGTDAFSTNFALDPALALRFFQLIDARWGANDEMWLYVKQVPIAKRTFWSGVTALASRIAKMEKEEQAAERLPEQEASEVETENSEEEDSHYSSDANEEHNDQLKPDLPSRPRVLVGPRRDRDLDLAWIDCLLPGHPSTGFPLPTSVICILRPITRHNTGEKSWVARYAGTEGLKVSPLDKSQRLHQKTRSQTFADAVEEHDAFRVTLLWLWRRHLCHAPEQASKQRLPEHVVRALAPRANGELSP